MRVTTSLDLLAMLLLAQPWLLLSAFAARVVCWLMPSLRPPTPPGQSQQSCSPASWALLCICRGFTLPQDRTSHASWLNFRRSLSVHFSSCFLLEGTSALKRINWFTQHDGVCKSDAGVFHLLYQDISKDVKISFWLTQSFRAYKELLYTEVSHSHIAY